MIIFPAIDLKDGKVVRLKQGKFDEVTVYNNDPLSVAKQWQGMGAQWLHVVDLDGALEGKRKNSRTVMSIARGVKIPVQTGGGIRTIRDIEDLLKGGVSRVILGTKIIEDKKFLKEALKKFKDKIAVSLDCNGGYVAGRGWTITVPIKATDLSKDLEKLGLRCLIYTDIARDGMLKGPNLKGLKQMLAVTKIPLIASGGISGLEDIQNLLALQKDGLMGAITGKAIYEGRLDLKKAIQLCSTNG